MPADLLKHSFDQYYPLPISFWQDLAASGKIVSLEKESTLKAPNTVEQYLYFLLEGCGGILLWHKNNFLCSDLVFQHDFLCDYFSFITQQPTPYEVITFEKASLFKLSFEALTTFTDNNPLGDKFWRYATQGLFLEKHQQYIQAFTNTAEEIYEKILQQQPDILQRVPQKYIASYLGITPQSLSRIRAKLS